MFGGAPARPFRPCLPVWRQKARAMEVPARVYRPRLHRPRKCPGGGVTLKLGVSDMQIENIAIDRLSISKANMRQGKKQIGRASCRESVCHTCRSRGTPYN